MGKNISATEAARHFSELLNRIRFRRQRYTIVRGGSPVADLGPAESPPTRPLGELLALLKHLPPLDDERRSFARDVERGIRKTPGLPKKPAWE